MKGIEEALKTKKMGTNEILTETTEPQDHQWHQVRDFLSFSTARLLEFDQRSFVSLGFFCPRLD